MPAEPAGIEPAGGPEQMLERLACLLEQERQCLLEWQPQRLLELSLERKALQQLLLVKLQRGPYSGDLEERLRRLNRRNRTNLRLVQAAIQVVTSLRSALGALGGSGYGARGQQLAPEAGPLLKTVV